MDRLRKGDLVAVTAGKYKGSRGRILRFANDNTRVVVEQVAMVKRHVKAGSPGNQQGGIVEKEGSIHISNVMPIDPGSDKPTRVKIKVEGGERRRVGKSGTVIEAQK